MPKSAVAAPRYLPERKFPAYSFVPGLWPHPRHAGGHAHGLPADPPSLLNAAQPRKCLPFLRGLDLFNHGYYWEAHEEWEGLWRAADSAGEKALLQGLIRLAAAGVKVRQGLLPNVHSHGQAAHNLFALAAQQAGSAVFCGLDLPSLSRFAQDITQLADTKNGMTEQPVQVVFPQVLRLL